MSENVSSNNLTGLYGSGGTPIPNANADVIVRGDLYVLSGNILTTASTGNIFPANATTINLGNDATNINLGAETGSLNFAGDNLVLRSTATGPGNAVIEVYRGGGSNTAATFTWDESYPVPPGTEPSGRFVSNVGITASGLTGGYVQIAPNNDDTTITTTGGSGQNLIITSDSGLVQVNANLTATGDITASGGTFGNVSVGVVNNNTINNSSGSLLLSSTTGDVGLIGVGTLYSDQSSFLLLNAPTTITAFDSATSLTMGETTGTTTIRNSLTVDGDTITLAQDTRFNYSENNDRANRPEVKSTTGNTSGWRVLAPNGTTSANANLTVFGSDDINNGEFLNIQASGSTTAPFAIRTGKFTAGVLGASGEEIGFTDGNTLYASINPAGPTNGTDLTTKTYVDSLPAGGVTSVTGGTHITASPTTGAVVVSTDATASNTVSTIMARDANGDFAAGVGAFESGTLGQVIIGGSTNGRIEIGQYNRASAGTPFVDFHSSASAADYDVRLIASGGGGGDGLGTLDIIAATTEFSGDVTLKDTLTLQGSTSGSVALAAPAVAGSQAYTLPTALPGVSGYVLSSDTSGVMSWVANPDTNTTYTIDSTSTTGGANLNLVGSDSTTDSVAYLGSGATTVTRTDANTITIASTDTNTTYTQDVSSTTGGANLNLVGSDSTTDSVKFAGGTNVSIVATDASTMTINATDTNTTYDFAASSTTGGANLNLTGSDSTTDTVKLTNGGHITATYTSATEVTLGSDATDTNTVSTIVARDASGNFSASGATLGNVTVGVDSDQTVSTTSGNLTLQTAAGVSAGTLVLTAGANGAITLAPNGTGNVVNTFSNGGNLTNNRNYVFGAIRNATTAAAGDVWNFNTTGLVGPLRGISLDNSADTTKNPGEIIRSYSGSAATGQRGRLVFEKARNTVASPSANQAADLLGSIEATGYSSTGWVNDTISASPGNMVFVANEAWTSNTNLGTGFAMNLAPTATTISTAANLVQALNINPQLNQSRSDNFTWGLGKSATTFSATGSSISSTTLTIGTVTTGTVAVGQFIQTATLGILSGTYIVANISGSGSGSTWVVSQSQTVGSTTITGTSGAMYLNSSGNLDVLGSATVRGTSIVGSNLGNTYATINTGSATFTNTGINNFIRQGSTGAQVPAVLIRYQRTDQTGPQDSDGVDFRLSVGGTSTTDNIARFDAVYKSSGDNEIGMSVSADSFVTDTDRIYVGSRASTKIRTTPSGGGTAGDTATFTQLATTIKSDTITLEAAGGTDYLVIDANKALFSKVIRTKITTDTIAKGGTYTPAATALNSIILEVTAGSGTTTIDVSNLTVAGENGVFDVMIYNNSGGSINANGFVIINGGNTALDHAANIANGDRAMFEINCVDIYANAKYAGDAV